MLTVAMLLIKSILIKTVREDDPTLKMMRSMTSASSYRQFQSRRCS